MEELKCVHKGCGKKFTDPEEPCVYHPGPPEFHEGQKGWKCCKPRVLTFDEFMNIPPCTTGKHSTVDDTPVEAKKPMPEETDLPRTKPILRDTSSIPPPRMAQPQQAPSPSPAPPESDSDDPAAEIEDGTTCKRRGCGQSYSRAAGRGNESCVHHPGQALFHEGSKGWTCCKRRVLEFDEFMKIEGCKTKSRHLFVGNKKGKSGGPEIVETVRNDFYQTPASLMASFYLKKIDAKVAKVDFSSPSTVDLDLPTTDNKRYKTTIPLYGLIDTEKSSYKIMGTKLELTLVKSDGLSWPVLRSDDRSTGEIIQVGSAGRA